MLINQIEFQNYKCFKSAKINCIKPINIIVGKNNIGKSSVLDIIEMIYNYRTIDEKTKIYITDVLTENIISKVFDKNRGGGSISGNHYEFGQNYIGKEIVYQRKNQNVNDVPEDFNKYNEDLPMEQVSYWGMCARNIKIQPKITKRILAERNIFPEDNDSSMDVDSNGNGITRIITNYLNRSQYEESLVKEKLLNKLNEIMGEDATFTEIVTQQIETEYGTKWEIFLREEGKGRISLSNSGSGLKTILMVLVYTILIPDVEKKDLSEYIFLFEELENNLHPSLERRLLSYVESLAESNATFFLTTHSNVTLDAYQNSELINILHVQKVLDEVKIFNISENIQKNNILNDLGVKASDLLQSNGIIWVEGPSDRVYIKKWLELFGCGELREGKDYQCVFYGGRLLSNLTFEEENELINLMSVNRNSIIVLDSDKKNLKSSLNDTKKRIIKEAEKNNILVWVTKGREIENYVPEHLIKRYYDKETSRKKFDQFQNIEDYIDMLKKNEGKKFLRSKTEFARNILKDATKEDFQEVYDLKKKINDVEIQILSWNYID